MDPNSPNIIEPQNDSSVSNEPLVQFGQEHTQVITPGGLQSSGAEAPPQKSENISAGNKKMGIFIKIFNLLYLILPIYILAIIASFNAPGAGLMGVESSFLDVLIGVTAVLAILVRLVSISALIKNLSWKFKSLFAVFLIDIFLIVLESLIWDGSFIFELGSMYGYVIQSLFIFPYDIFLMSLSILPGPLVMILVNALYLKFKNQ